MDIFVVSRSRWQKSDTLDRLGGESTRVKLVVPEFQVKEYDSLATRYGCRLVGCPYDGISLTRKFCGEICEGWCFLMLDDDLKFYRRVTQTDWRLRYPEDLQDTVKSMLTHVESCLRKYIHVAISAREGNNNLPYEGVYCSRPLRALGYRKDQFLKVQHGRVRVMEDFDVTLQLLKQGYKNHVIAKWAQGQIVTQMAGGCSDYRTLKVHEDNVRKFADLHPGLVKLRQKKNRSGGEFGERLEATIYWQKAYESSNKIPPAVNRG